MSMIMISINCAFPKDAPKSYKYEHNPLWLTNELLSKIITNLSQISLKQY